MVDIYMTLPDEQVETRSALFFFWNITGSIFNMKVFYASVHEDFSDVFMSRK